MIVPSEKKSVRKGSSPHAAAAAAASSEQAGSRGNTNGAASNSASVVATSAGPSTNISAASRGPQQSLATQQAAAELNGIRERRNWLIHTLYTRQEYSNCLSVIEAQLRDTEGTCEYALYVKGLLKRMEGALSESLTLLQAAVLVSPENVESRKQFGRALFLLGRHEEALETFREAQALTIAKGQKDWEVELHIGLTLVYLRDYEEAVNAFVRSLGVLRHDSTFLHLGRTLVKMKSYEGAVQVYQEALEGSPGNPDLLAALGHLYMKTQAVAEAFSCFGACLAEEPAHLGALVAVSSVMQANRSYEEALLKYRTAVRSAPQSAQLWNNIGVCFFGQMRAEEMALAAAAGGGTQRTASDRTNELYAAVACLRKSIILAPLEWITNYNLGVVLLTLGRHVSAFHYLTAAISLNSAYPPAFMYLGVCLSLINDVDNACHAYDRALAMQDDLLFRVNYAITLVNSNLQPQAARQLQMVLPVWNRLTPEQQRESSPALPAAIATLDAMLAEVVPSDAPAPNNPGFHCQPSVPSTEAEGDAVSRPDAPASAFQPSATGNAERPSGTPAPSAPSAPREASERKSPSSSASSSPASSAAAPLSTDDRGAVHEARDSPVADGVLDDEHEHGQPQQQQQQQQLDESDTHTAADAPETEVHPRRAASPEGEDAAMGVVDHDMQATSNDRDGQTVDAADTAGARARSSRSSNSSSNRGSTGAKETAQATSGPAAAATPAAGASSEGVPNEDDGAGTDAAAPAISQRSLTSLSITESRMDGSNFDTAMQNANSSSYNTTPRSHRRHSSSPRHGVAESGNERIERPETNKLDSAGETPTGQRHSHAIARMVNADGTTMDDSRRISRLDDVGSVTAPVHSPSYSSPSASVSSASDADNVHEGEAQ